MDPSKAIDSSFATGRYGMKPAEFATDIVAHQNRDSPISPALCMEKNLDGTNTPSMQSTSEHRVFRLREHERENFVQNFPTKTSANHYNLLFNLQSPRAAPIPAAQLRYTITLYFMILRFTV